MEILGCFGIALLFILIAIGLLLEGMRTEAAAVFGFALFLLLGCAIMIKMEKPND
jgi:hypothetical protein